MEPKPTTYPALKFLNGFAEIHKTRDSLPHWQQESATYFLTFRLADSIPATLLREWKQERDRWLLDHPKPWSMETEADYHKRFSSRVERHLDQGSGSCLLAEPANAETVANAFSHFNRVRYLLHAWAIMPNHAHLLLSLDNGADLGETVASWKRFTATRINRSQGKSGAVWQADYFDRIIRDWDHFMNAARYIRRNPVKAKIPPGQSRLHEAEWVKRLLS